VCWLLLHCIYATGLDRAVYNKTPETELFFFQNEKLSCMNFKIQYLRVLLLFTSDELKMIFKGSNSCESAKSVVELLDTCLEHRRSQGVQWVHVHPRTIKKLGV